ncbi:hypothetical protein Bca4012_035615 [Brassica carinata]
MEFYMTDLHSDFEDRRGCELFEGAREILNKNVVCAIKELRIYKTPPPQPSSALPGYTDQNPKAQTLTQKEMERRRFDPNTPSSSSNQATPSQPSLSFRPWESRAEDADGCRGSKKMI